MVHTEQEAGHRPAFILLTRSFFITSADESVPVKPTRGHRGVGVSAVRQSAAPPPAVVFWKRTLIDVMVPCGRSRLVSPLAAQRGRQARRAADLLPH